MTRMRISIGCDHAGYKLKDELKRWLSDYDFVDRGTHDADSVDYPDHIHPVANDVESGRVAFGIIICGSGNGAAITANKHPGIRAALCWKSELGSLAKQHNNANIIALPARFISVGEAKDIIRAYLDADFEGGRHQKRIDKIPFSQADV